MMSWYVLTDEVTKHRLDKQAMRWIENWLNYQVQMVVVCSTNDLLETGVLILSGIEYPWG